jgi:hypothetical protein
MEFNRKQSQAKSIIATASGLNYSGCDCFQARCEYLKGRNWRLGDWGDARTEEVRLMGAYCSLLCLNWHGAAIGQDKHDLGA